MALLLPVFDRLNRYDGWTQYGVPVGIAAGISGAVSKMVSSTAFYPLDVIRTNMRFKEGKKVPFLAVVRDVIGRPGGAYNLFRGIGW